MVGRMSVSILENGLNYILDAANWLTISDGFEEEGRLRAGKQSLQYLYTGIELVMQARLYAENWAYIFADIDEADKVALGNGHFAPVSYMDALNRLERLCGVDFPAKDKKTLVDLRVKRNIAEYSDDDINIKAAEAVLYRALCVVMNFVTDHKKEFRKGSASETGGKGLTKEEKAVLADIQDFMEELEKRYRVSVKRACEDVVGACSADLRVECPECGETFLVPNDAGAVCRCYFCGYEADGESAAKAYLLSVKGLKERRIVADGGIYPLYRCPKCNKKSLVDLGDQSECFSCRRLFDNTPNGQKKVIPNQAEGIAAAKKRGTVFGRPKIQLPKNFPEIYELWAAGELSNREAAAKCNMAVSTFRNRAAKYKEIL